MKKAIIMMAMSVLGFTAQAQKASNQNPKTKVLVHGAWSDASSWDAVIPWLKAKGEEVINVNPAGHGWTRPCVRLQRLKAYPNPSGNGGKL